MWKLISADEILASRDENNYVEGYVKLHISEVIDSDLELFLDLLSNNLVGSDLLMDINYEVVALAEKDTLVFKVTGDVSNIIEG